MTIKLNPCPMGPFGKKQPNIGPGWKPTWNTVPFDPTKTKKKK